MGVDTRLNLLLTPSPKKPGESQTWHQTLSQLLVPLGVRTFEATSGSQAVELMERHPIHLAVVDTRLPAICGMDVLQLMQRLRDHGSRTPNPPQPDAGGQNVQFHLNVEEKSPDGTTQRRIQVRFDSPSVRPTGPVVILIAPPPAQQDPQLLQEALKFNAFSVLSEPVDVNLALEVMARAMKRCFSGNWPC